MNQINLMLEEKNRNLLDEKSFQILSAFKNGQLLVGEKRFQFPSTLLIQSDIRIYKEIAKCN